MKGDRVAAYRYPKENLTGGRATGAFSVIKNRPDLTQNTKTRASKELQYISCEGLWMSIITCTIMDSIYVESHVIYLVRCFRLLSPLACRDHGSTVGCSVDSHIRPVLDTIPPSTTNFWPVMYPAAELLQRKAVAFATSRLDPIFPVGTWACLVLTKPS